MFRASINICKRWLPWARPKPSPISSLPMWSSRNFQTGSRRRAEFSRFADLHAAYERGRIILQPQRYDVQRIVEAGDEVAVELEWSGILAVPVMNLPAGSEMKAFVAMSLTFRDGKIVSRRNYDCYSPFGE
jgi:ketosteroid isomerase-like protein